MGAPIDWQDQNGYAPLHVASISNNIVCMRLLIKSKANPNIKNRRGDTSLLCAAQKHKMIAVRELVWSLCDLEIPNNEGKTAAKKAKEKRPRDIREYLAKESGHMGLAEYLTNEAPREQVRAKL